MTTHLCRNSKLSHAVWLEHGVRPFVHHGGLRTLVGQDGLMGLTTTPEYFERALAEADVYDEDIRHLADENEHAEAVFTALAVKDVQEAADLFRPVHEATFGEHGFVGIGVSPHLAYDSGACIEAGRSLWRMLDRPNIMIRIPATQEALPAIRVLLHEGINVDATLLFGLSRYCAVAESFLNATAERFEGGVSTARGASVAGFQVGPIDAAIDPVLARIVEDGGARGGRAKKLLGRVGLASARLAYGIFTDVFGDRDFEGFDGSGAVEQRLVWSGLGAGKPGRDRVRQIDALVGPRTISALNLETLEVYRDRGDSKTRLQERTSEARQVFEELGELGIDINQVTRKLEADAVTQLRASYNRVLATIAEKLATVHAA